MDETGNRLPDKKPDKGRENRDWFAFGGYIIAKEDKNHARAMWQAMVDKWQVQHPFHITDMMSEKKKWGWLGRVTEVKRTRFWEDYRAFLSSIRALGQACVIDRPGYVARGYLEQHGANRWLLCRTGFDIAVERAAKYARSQGRKLNIVFESDPPYNPIVEGYFKDLKANGLAFASDTSGKYNPLSQQEFAETLTTIEYKDKSSRLLQIADSYIYAIARGKYDRQFHIWRELRDNQRIINFALDDNETIKAMGIKYSCFDAKK
jgi:hypothetical protein